MKRYVVTTAVPGASLNMPFYKAIKNYCTKHSAELLVLPSTPVYKADLLDGRIPENEILYRAKLLNSKLRISDIPINPQAINPTTGLSRQAQTDGSFIFASPKQSLESIPNSNSKLPHILMTTGAITKPYYKKSRVGVVAAQDHVNGALLVEIVNSVEYRFTQVQADPDGSFINLFTKYSADGTTKRVDAEALIPGDLHAGSTDPDVKDAIFELIKLGRPKYFIAHDLADFISINPHHKGKNLTRAKLSDQLDLMQELKLIWSELKQYHSALTKARNNAQVIVVPSNHDDFLHRYIETGDYVYDPRNYKVGHEIALAAIKGHDEFEYALMRLVKRIPQVRFLDLDEDFKVTPKRIQLGAHGHLGPNGARGSAQNLERSYANAVIGHSHSPKILRGIWQVGTSTWYKLGYNKGPSGWVQTLCIVYPNGSRQMITVINGKWRS